MPNRHPRKALGFKYQVLHHPGRNETVLDWTKNIFGQSDSFRLWLWVLWAENRKHPRSTAPPHSKNPLSPLIMRVLLLGDSIEGRRDIARMN
jgi:hypothetical protein